MVVAIDDLTIDQQVLAILVSLGKSNRHIAATMGLARPSVDGALYRLYRKLGFDQHEGHPRQRLAEWWKQANGSILT